MFINQLAPIYCTEKVGGHGICCAVSPSLSLLLTIYRFFSKLHFVSCTSDQPAVGDSKGFLPFSDIQYRNFLELWLFSLEQSIFSFDNLQNKKFQMDTVELKNPLLTCF
jgi:hypothetical protein